MVSLRRTVRFAINDNAPPIGDAAPGSGGAVSGGAAGGAGGCNGYAGVPGLWGLGRHYELTIACSGEVSPLTGYFLNIKEIDAAVRRHAVPRIAAACDGGEAPALVLRRVVESLAEPLRGSVRSVRWALTPYHSIEMTSTDPTRVDLRQKFEFAASHRLHAAGLSDEENRALFGKCNHPSGHGHNYIIEPRVSVRVDDRGIGRPSLPEIEAIVDRVIIQRFDHKHLNLDLPEFATGTGVNPSVENIAKRCYDLLRPEIQTAGGDLRAVTVWETEKTSCVYGE